MRPLAWIACAACALSAPACGRPLEVAGTYRATGEALPLRLAPSDQTGALLRAAEDAGGWSMRLDVRDDGTFAATMRVAARAITMSGTWVLRGRELRLTRTHEQGRELPRPHTVAAEVRDGAVLLSPGPSGPRVELRRGP